ncbi:MAG: hypothetical protein ABR981_05605, partial [Candidatus Micrarchaeaceae archaeon]
VSQSVYYVCQNPIYNHTTGIISVYLGQDTGSNWTTTSFVFVPIGTQINKGIPSISFNSYPANTFYSENKLTSGKIVNVSLQVNDTNPPINIGTSAKGTIWVRYTIQGNLTQQYAQMASVNIKAS